MRDRTNEEWLSDLAEVGPLADESLRDLREILRRGLAKALRSHSGVDDSFVEDATQDAILKILANLSGFRGDSKFTTWVVAVGVRVAFSELRRARWRDVSLDDLNRENVRVEPVGADAAGGGTERDEVIRLMRRVIDTDLTERQRSLLVAELNGVPQAELCERLGLTRNALYKLGHDARKKLKNGLLAAGVTEDDVRTFFQITS